MGEHGTLEHAPTAQGQRFKPMPAAVEQEANEARKARAANLARYAGYSDPSNLAVAPGARAIAPQTDATEDQPVPSIAACRLRSACQVKLTVTVCGQSRSHISFVD